jgi:hypothetical protein
MPLLLAASAPSPEAVRETARRVLAGPDYNLENTLHPIAWAAEVFRWIRRMLHALADLFEGSGLPIPPLFFWVLLALIVLGLMAWWLFRRHALRIPAGDGIAASEAEIDDLPSDVRVLLERSNTLAESGNYVDASRLLYRASLLRLEEQRGGFLRRGLTNLEYLRTFRSAWVLENLRVFVDLINWKWYRDSNFDAADYRRCRDAYERLDARLREGA